MLLLVAVLTLLTALPVLAAEPTELDLGTTAERIFGGGTCDRGFFERTSAYGNCPGGQGDAIWRW